MKKLLKKIKKDKRGFTLIELIVVVAILGVLAAVLIPTVSGQINTARTNAARANAQTVYTAAQMVLTSGGTVADGGAAANAAVAAIVGTTTDTYAIVYDEDAKTVTSVTYTINGVSATYPS